MLVGNFLFTTLIYTVHSLIHIIFTIITFDYRILNSTGKRLTMTLLKHSYSNMNIECCQ